MSETFAEKIKTLNFGLPSRRGPKVTTERDSKLEATTTEHWDDRQDIHLKPKTIRVSREQLGA